MDSSGHVIQQRFESPMINAFLEKLSDSGNTSSRRRVLVKRESQLKSSSLIGKLSE